MSLFPNTTASALLGAALACAALACGRADDGEEPTPAESARPAGSSAMAARLARIAAESDPFANPYLNAERAALLLARPTPNEPAQRRNREYRIAMEQLLAGQTSEGIERLLAVEPAFAPGSLRPLLASAYLRQAEQENCLEHHSSESCLLPIRGDGVHTVRRGAEQAIAVLEPHLAAHPEQLGPRWLLNLAYMTLGRWPDEVPERWLLAPALFASEHELARFDEVAGAAGVDFIGLAGGAALDDFDGDGDLDVFATSGGLSGPLRFAVNRGDGTFEERSAEAHLGGLVGGLNLVHADYDGDGHVDVLVLRGAWLGVPPATDGGRHPNSLLRNRGDGTFEDVTEAAGVLSFHPTQTAVWRDFDGDGQLDLFIGNETASADARHPCELYRGRGDGTFEEVAAAAGVAAVGLVKGVCAGDADGDGRDDVYVSRLGAANLLFLNRTEPGGAPRFEEAAGPAGVSEPIRSFPCWFFDYDNDGHEDLFVSGYGASDPEVIGDVAADYLGEHRAERCRLYRSRGDGTFEDRAPALGLDGAYFTMGCNYGDLDGDGWLDFYLGTGDPRLWVIVPNRMFRNDGGRRFQDVTTSGGFGHLQKGHGVAFGDIDGDGDQDVYANLGGFHTGDVYPNALFRNPGGHGTGVARGLTLLFEGVRANRFALGARVEVQVRAGEVKRSIHRTVSTGGSFGGSSQQLEVGLGAADAILGVLVRWPGSGATERFDGFDLDGTYRLREGSGSPKRVANHGR